MRISYDPEIDAAYVYLVDDIGRAAVAQTYSCDPAQVKVEINLDFDDEGRFLGIEIQDASRILPTALLQAASAQ
jgi:uncharacterized protein YuzE